MTMLVTFAPDDLGSLRSASPAEARIADRSEIVGGVAPGGAGVRRLVIQFALAGAVALLALGVASVVASRRSGTNQAIRDAIDRTGVLATAVFEPRLTPELLAGDAAAREGLTVVAATLGDGAFVHYRVWSSDGLIVHADDAALIGTILPIGDDAIEAFRTGVPRAEVSELTAEENARDRSDGQLLEVYYPVRASDGTLLLLETYQPMTLVEESARAIWWQFLPAVLVPLILLQLVQVPLAVRLARQSHQDRVQRLRSADEATTRERRAIAHDLHDGAVQDLAGVSMSMSALATRVPTEQRDEVARLVRAINDSVESMRTLFTEIYPADVSDATPDRLLADIGGRLAERGIACEIDCAPSLNLSLQQRRIVHRVAHEACRNVVRHADARRVTISVASASNGVSVTVADDGCGFEIGECGLPSPRGHFGLRMLRDLVESSGGSTTIRSAPGAGTIVEAWVPA